MFSVARNNRFDVTDTFWDPNIVWSVDILRGGGLREGLLKTSSLKCIHSLEYSILQEFKTRTNVKTTTNEGNNNNNALLALTTKRHIYMASDKLQ